MVNSENQGTSNLQEIKKFNTCVYINVVYNQHTYKSLNLLINEAIRAVLYIFVIHSDTCIVYKLVLVRYLPKFLPDNRW